MKQDRFNEAMTTEIKESSKDGQSFLSRWSQRKLQVREVKTPPRKADDSPVLDRELTDADMPPLESLDERSDYSGFFSTKVSSELRRLALRKLFHAPAFQVRDGLDDYDEDFTRFAGLGNIVTREMKHRLEVEARRLARNACDKRAEEDSGAEPSPRKADFSASVHNPSAERAEQKPDRA